MPLTRGRQARQSAWTERCSAGAVGWPKCTGVAYRFRRKTGVKLFRSSFRLYVLCTDSCCLSFRIGSRSQFNLFFLHQWSDWLWRRAPLYYTICRFQSTRSSATAERARDSETAIQDHFKVIRCYVNRRGAYDFLLTLDSNLTSVFNRSWDIIYTYCSLHLSIPHLWKWKKTAGSRWICSGIRVQRESARFENGYSRLLKVIRCCANRRGIYDFLLTLNSHLTSVFNRSWPPPLR